MPTTAALLTGLLFSPLQTRLERRGIPSFLAACLVTGVFLAAIVIGIRLLIIPFETWSERLPDMWTALRAQLNDVRSLVLAVQDATEAVQKSAGLEESSASAPAVMTAPTLLSNLAAGVPSMAAEIILFFGVFFFFLASRTRVRAKLLAFCLAMHLVEANLITPGGARHPDDRGAPAGGGLSGLLALALGPGRRPPRRAAPAGHQGRRAAPDALIAWPYPTASL